MQQQLTLVQTCIATVAFLDKEYFTHYSEDLPCCVSELAFSGEKESWLTKPETWDPAAWYDWMDVACKYLHSDTACKDTTVSILQGYRIMQAFVHDYACRLNYDDMKKLAVTLDISDENLLHSHRWKDWLLCINATLNDKIEPEGGLLSRYSYITQQQSLEIMQQFLKNYYEKTKDIESQLWFEHIQQLDLNHIQDAVCADWLEIYQKYIQKHPNQLDITVLEAFNVMLKFVVKQYQRGANQDLVNLLKTLRVDKNQKSVIPDDTLYAWLHAAYAVVFK